MNLDYEKNYQHILDQITQQLEILMMDILLTSINRLKYFRSGQLHMFGIDH